jgi:hypothetical protein
MSQPASQRRGQDGARRAGQTGAWHPPPPGADHHRMRGRHPRGQGRLVGDEHADVLGVGLDECEPVHGTPLRPRISTGPTARTATRRWRSSACWCGSLSVRPSLRALGPKPRGSQGDQGPVLEVRRTRRKAGASMGYRSSAARDDRQRLAVVRERRTRWWPRASPTCVPASTVIIPSHLRAVRHRHSGSRAPDPVKRRPLRRGDESVRPGSQLTRPQSRTVCSRRSPRTRTSAAPWASRAGHRP